MWNSVWNGNTVIGFLTVPLRVPQEGFKPNHLMVLHLEFLLVCINQFAYCVMWYIVQQQAAMLAPSPTTINSCWYQKYLTPGSLNSGPFEKSRFDFFSADKPCCVYWKSVLMWELSEPPYWPQGEAPARLYALKDLWMPFLLIILHDWQQHGVWWKWHMIHVKVLYIKWRGKPGLQLKMGSVLHKYVLHPNINLAMWRKYC